MPNLVLKVSSVAADKTVSGSSFQFFTVLLKNAVGINLCSGQYLDKCCHCGHNNNNNFYLYICSEALKIQHL